MTQHTDFDNMSLEELDQFMLAPDGTTTRRLKPRVPLTELCLEAVLDDSGNVVSVSGPVR